MGIFYIQTKAPYGDTQARDGIDALLAAAAFEQVAGVLFKGDGVWQLLQHQSADAIGLKSLEKMLKALPMYGVEKIFVCQETLKRLNLSLDQLIVQPTVLSAEEQGQLINQQSCVLSF